LEIILMRADQMMSRHVMTIGVDAPLVDAINTMLKHGASGQAGREPHFEYGRLSGAQEGGDFVSLQEQPSTTDDMPL
jgi:hypothetical protein